VYRVAFPLLQKYDWRAAIFIAPGENANARDEACLAGLYGREMLRWREIRELHAHGMTIGAHTLTHCDLTRVDPAQAAHEIIESGKILSRVLDAPCSLFAYPYGRYDMRTRATVAAQYDAAFSTQLGLANAESDCFALERVEMYYLRADWAARGLTKNWLPYYLAARNVPRRVRYKFGG
jgi:peptidoglycan/xylan/chitin deacetylase (PgdA/CDA1 family)